MFTRDSKKARLVLASLATVAILYAGINIGLLGLAHWAERSAGTYPYRSEDWLRYLLPTIYDSDGHDRMLLAGESAVRENFIFERFQRAFPDVHTLQGGLSLGTFDDVLLSLDYIENVYGEEALPEVLVLGVSPRFVANLPRDRSPLVSAITRYSPYYRVERSVEGSRLVPKTVWESWRSRLRFLLKQQARYRSALIALARRFFKEDVPYEEFQDDFERMHALRGVLTFHPGQIPGAREFVDDVGLRAAIGRWFRVYVSPYKYHYLEPFPRDGIRDWLLDPSSFWVDVHAWNPEPDAVLIRSQAARLLGISRRHGIQLYAINLPENPLGRQLYEPGYYESYLRILLESLGDTPFLDLRELLAEDDFYDVVHARLPSALRVTDRVIEFMRNHGSERPLTAGLDNKRAEP